MIFGKAIPIGVFGPASSVDNAIARFDGTTGRKIQGSLVSISDAGAVNIPEGQTYTVGGAAIPWGQISKTGSSLADLATRSAGDLSSGNLDAARLPTGGSWGLSSDLNIDDKLYIDNYTGFVGIGTAIPQERLHVQSSGGQGVRVLDATAARLYLTSNNTDGWLLQHVVSDQRFRLYNQSVGQEQLTVTSGGNVGIGTTSPTAVLHVASDILRLQTAKTPASASAAGNAGDICWDSGYVYVCVATNTWKRASLATW